MRLLFAGDVVGSAGRKAVLEYVPLLRKKLQLDAVIVNAENAAHGYGITQKIAKQFYEAGVDVITCGDHAFDQQEMRHVITTLPYLLRPGNLSSKLPGVGYRVFTIQEKRLLVIHLHAQLFMKLLADNPFAYVEKVLQSHLLTKQADAIVVDFHGEATSERMAMGHFLDGKVSLVAGSHTHVPTADLQILPGGTAYQTDAGMCGDYDSVIGFHKAIAISGFTYTVRSQKMQVAKGPATFCGVFIETNDKTGLAIAAEPVRIGGRLQQSIPEVT